LSGGKGIKGPNDTGLLFGRKDLIYLARLQFSPHRGVGRPCKVDRTSIIGLLTALELYAKQDEEKEFKQWDQKVARLIDDFKGTPNVMKIERVIQHASPNVKLIIDESKLGLTAKEVRQRLMRGNPRILCGPQNWNNKDEILICVRELADNEEHIVVNKLKEILTK
jgi:L-seryl-tRNA(Ser) seleniumtransferase